ncbi:aminomethyl-transferring glycine dehydrogenase subunit GcvPA [Candidatus Bipolaricaulota bacterium]|nr:aminomethyl-transferring glycine dehydrogenase subunit GcvPA [Candidatus Bipolaricaulota bacterium]
MRYIPNTSDDRREMLAAIGVSSVEELFSDIPQDIVDRFEALGLPAHSEQETVAHVSALADRNRAHQAVCLLGGGVYDHYVPSIVGHVLSRSEFYTAYTPYQPEISQGTLTAMFEFQTMVCELTGMEVANASMYDGATALAESVLMADRIRREGGIAVPRTLHPRFRRVLDTYCWAADVEIVEIPYGEDGRIDRAAMPDAPAAVVVQSPNAFGVIERLDGLKERLGEGLLIVAVNPLSLGILSPPGEHGADIVVGEGQPLGLPMGMGGPLLGLFATRERHIRQMPGRVSGRTVDAEGKIGYAMAAQTREQHIRRERATSNICTNSALCALAATVYLASVGAEGLRHVAELNLQKAHYLAGRLSELNGFRLAFDGDFFNEFTVEVPGDPQELRRTLRDAGFLVTDPDELRGLGVENALRFAVTERRTIEELDRLVDVLRGAR